MQMPVFLTEPPQLPSHPSPSPRKQKKSRVTKNNGFHADALAVALVPSPRPSRSRSPRMNKVAKGQDSERSVSTYILTACVKDQLRDKVCSK